MKPTILFVDDEEDVVSVYTEALSYAFPDHDIQGATSFEMACALARSLTADDFALVCVDEALGSGRSGLELVQTIRQTFPQLPALLYTGKATSAMADSARAANVGVLWKPMALKTYLSEVGKRLQ